MGVFLDPETPAVLLHHHAKIDVQSRSVRRDGIIERVFDVSPGELFIGRVNILGDIFRIKIFQTAEPALMVDLGLLLAIFVQDHDPGNIEGRGDFLVVRTEGRGDMDYTCTILSGHIVTGDHPESLTFLSGSEPRDQLLVTDADQV